jgi:hypothetical protein
MAKKSPETHYEDPKEALGRWLAQRQAAKNDYKKVLNERENELLEASGRSGPKSNRSKTRPASWKRQNCSATRYTGWSDGRSTDTPSRSDIWLCSLFSSRSLSPW